MWKLNHHGIFYGLKIKDVAGGELTHRGRDAAHYELTCMLLNFVVGEKRHETELGIKLCAAKVLFNIFKTCSTRGSG